MATESDRPRDEEAMLAHVKERIESRIREGSTEGFEADLGQLRNLTSSLKRPLDLAQMLAALSWYLAETKPMEAIRLGTEAVTLVADKVQTAKAHNAVAIAYLHLGDEVRALQHRAKALEFDSSTSDLAFLAALRWGSTELKQPPKLAVEATTAQQLNDWLISNSPINAKDLHPRFGDFVTNDEAFCNNARDLLTLLTHRLKAKLNKPDCYLLLADPGSGKSFLVRQFAQQLQENLQSEVLYLERNLSAYETINEAFTDIVGELLVALVSHQNVLLFVDEVDSRFNGGYIFQRMISPMNGDPFFFQHKMVSFSKRNLVLFYALSTRKAAIEEIPKWPDFLSRIPEEHRLKLPSFESPVEHIYRAIAMLSSGSSKAIRIQVAALLYIGLRNWSSARELELALQFGKARMPKQTSVFELAHIAVTGDELRTVANKEEERRYLCSRDQVVEIVPGPVKPRATRPRSL